MSREAGCTRPSSRTEAPTELSHFKSAHYLLEAADAVLIGDSEYVVGKRIFHLKQSCVAEALSPSSGRS